jgi:D-glycero-alpha-D-manno-heptose-7-phosphate kinase
MIITRTPFRISFFGGGTDFPLWYRENGGSVLSTTIDKYCYLSCRVLPPFFDYKYRIIYSQQENKKTIGEIEHPAVRAILEYMDIDHGLIVHHDADLPARSGLGSSSSFTVGLLHNLYSMKGRMKSQEELASEAIHLEQNIMAETVGSQDQVAAAVGGFNRIDFGGHREFSVTPVTITGEKRQSLEENLLLFYTGIQRFASDVEKTKVKNIPAMAVEMSEIQGMVDEAISILNNNSSFEDFGTLLNTYWEYKKKLNEKSSTGEIDDIYDTALKAGALGGKILGAGSGGFILFYVSRENQENVKRALDRLLHVPFKFESSGSQVIHYNIGNETIQP